MSFPQKNFIGLKIGWKDVCEVGRYYNEKNREIMIPIHSMCNGKMRVGKEGMELFKYCPRCLVKIT